MYSFLNFVELSVFSCSSLGCLKTAISNSLSNKISDLHVFKMSYYMEIEKWKVFIIFCCCHVPIDFDVP